MDPQNRDQYTLDVLEEDQWLMDACRDLKLNVGRKSWDDPDFDWSTTRAVIFRSTWDYFDRFSEFEKWLHRIKSVTQFINPQELVFWNIDKRYLLELESQGVGIIPTHIVRQGNQGNLSEIADQKVWHDIVIKPTVSATARDTHCLTLEEYTSPSVQQMFNELCQQKTMMVQPFLSRVLEEGELSVIVIDGRVTHGLRKVAKAGDYRVQSDFGGSIHLEEPDENAIEIAEQVVVCCPAKPLYARVDLLKDDKGDWKLGELELVEPELWFRLYPKSAALLAKAIADHLANEGS